MVMEEVVGQRDSKQATMSTSEPAQEPAGYETPPERSMVAHAAEDEDQLADKEAEPASCEAEPVAIERAQ